MKGLVAIINSGKITNYVASRSGFTVFNKKSNHIVQWLLFDVLQSEKYLKSENELSLLFINKKLIHITENTLSSCRRTPYRGHRAVV